MKKEDYNIIIQKLTNPDEQTEALVELSDKLALDELEYINNQNTINSLRDINSKLALRITEPINRKPVEQEVNLYDNLIDKLKGELNNVK